MPQYRIFRSLGLTENESKVYVTLLDLGTAQAGQVTEKSGIHRRNVYDAIARLMEKGLVSFVTVNNKKLFSPVNPRRFLELIEEKKFELDTIKSDFQKIMPQLELQATMQPRHDVRFYKGVEGIKTVYEDIIRTGKDYIGYGPGQQIEKILKHYFKHFVNRRISAGIKLRIIYDEASRNVVKVNPSSKARYIPNQYSSRAALRIYGDKVALILMSEDEPLAIVIKNKGIADGYRKYFEIMWKAAKP
jgi:sugar-specific transcriptional regulator TrmB